MTATEFRQRLYSILGELAETGGTVSISHKNRRFRIVPEESSRFVDRLVAHRTLNVDPDDIVGEAATEWDWREAKNLDGLS